MTEDLKQYLIIDKLALDDELIQQASLHQEAGDAWADAVAKRDELKEQLAVIGAELDKHIRATQSGATEGKIKNLITSDPSHIKATNYYLRAKHNADKLAILKESFEQRNKALENLAKLYLGNYFVRDSVRATPTTDEVVYRTRRRRLAEKNRGS